MHLPGIEIKSGYEFKASLQVSNPILQNLINKFSTLSVIGHRLIDGQKLYIEVAIDLLAYKPFKS